MYSTVNVRRQTVHVSFTTKFYFLKRAFHINQVVHPHMRERKEKPFC